MDDNLEYLISGIKSKDIDGTKGLPENLFLLISSLIPIVNVDLLIRDSDNRILLAYRNDSFFEKSWHIPGGCLRFKETLMERVKKTALKEIGCELIVNPCPIAVRDVIQGEDACKKNSNVRCHNVAVLYDCKVPEGFTIDNGTLSENDSGYLRWFDKVPDNFMKIQNVYKDVLQDYF